MKAIEEDASFLSEIEDEGLDLGMQSNPFGLDSFEGFGESIDFETTLEDPRKDDKKYEEPTYEMPSFLGNKSTNRKQKPAATTKQKPITEGR